MRHPNRYNLEQHLQRHEIATMIHYPIPPHLSGAYAGKYDNLGLFPISEGLSKEILSLPMSSHISKQQTNEIIKAIWEAI